MSLLLQLWLTLGSFVGNMDANWVAIDSVVCHPNGKANRLELRGEFGAISDSTTEITVFAINSKTQQLFGIVARINGRTWKANFALVAGIYDCHATIKIVDRNNVTTTIVTPVRCGVQVK